MKFKVGDKVRFVSEFPYYELYKFNVVGFVVYSDANLVFPYRVLISKEAALSAGIPLNCVNTYLCREDEIDLA